MKGFYIEITNNLLEKKHIDQMGDSVWLFLWLLDKMTIIDSEKGTGKVLGGKPIIYKDIKTDLGISERTYRRWVDKLEKFGYINTIRTPRGLSVIVNKAKKNFKNKKVMCHNRNSDVPQPLPRYATNGTSNIRQKQGHIQRQGFSKLTEDQRIRRLCQ